MKKTMQKITLEELKQPTDEKGNPITYWGGLEKSKQERMYSEEKIDKILQKLEEIKIMINVR